MPSFRIQSYNRWREKSALTFLKELFTLGAGGYGRDGRNGTGQFKSKYIHKSYYSLEITVVVADLIEL